MILAPRGFFTPPVQKILQWRKDKLIAQDLSTRILPLQARNQLLAGKITVKPQNPNIHLAPDTPRSLP